jgi:hypothetical protein
MLFRARFPGTSGDYASTPDDAAFSALTNFSVLYLGSLTDWTPAAQTTLVSHLLTTGNQRAWRVYVKTDGVLGLQTTSDGTGGTSTLNESTVANSFTNGTINWILITRNSTTGVVKFYTAAYVLGSVAPPALGSFTQLGTDRTGATGAVHNSTTTLNVSSHSAGASENLIGDVYRTLLYTGLYGSGSETLVRDFNASDAADTADTSWASATTGETWTLNGGDVLLLSDAFPTAATATGVANTPSVTIASPASAATATGAAGTASPSVAPSAGAVSATGAANGPTGSVAPTGGHAAGTGTANTPSASIAPASGHASGTGAVDGATGSIAPTGGHAAATGAASDPSLSVAPTAGHSSATGAANTPSAGVAPSAGHASALCTAHNLSASLAVTAQNISILGTAYDATANSDGDAVVPTRRRFREDTDARDLLAERPREDTDAREPYVNRPAGRRGRSSAWWN